MAVSEVLSFVPNCPSRNFCNENHSCFGPGAIIQFSICRAAGYDETFVSLPCHAPMALDGADLQVYVANNPTAAPMI